MEHRLFRVIRYDEVASTNEVVKRAIEQGEPEGLVCRARIQTGGYGRQGRTWSSPAGGLYQSLLLRPDVLADMLSSLALVTALAVRAALLGLSGLDGTSIQVKWPNDIVCTQGKLSGISCETHAGGVCLGIGVNVLRPDAPLPAALGGSPAYLCDLAERRLEDRSVDDVGERILDRFAVLYPRWQARGFAAFVDEFNASSSLHGKPVRIVDIFGSTLAEGTAREVDSAGRLCVQTAGGIQPIASGEAHIV